MPASKNMKSGSYSLGSEVFYISLNILKYIYEFKLMRPILLIHENNLHYNFTRADTKKPFQFPLMTSFLL